VSPPLFVSVAFTGLTHPVSSLDATLMDLSASVDSKEVRFAAKPVEALERFLLGIWSRGAEIATATNVYKSKCTRGIAVLQGKSAGARTVSSDRWPKLL
jgi:hypothetical protein